MSAFIDQQARSHLVSFLEKVRDQSYTQIEWENFTLMPYQNKDLEEIRFATCKMIGRAQALDGEGKKLNAEDRTVLLDLIAELQK